MTNVGRNQILLRKVWPYYTKDCFALSHFGGDPKLTVSMPWPVCSSQGEERLPHFIAQIDCSDLPPCVGREFLPTRGVIYFFAHIASGDFWQSRVFHVDAQRSELSPRLPPKALERLHPVTKCFHMMYQREPQWLSGMLTEEEVEQDAKRLGYCSLIMSSMLMSAAPSEDFDYKDISKQEKFWVDEERHQEEREAAFAIALGGTALPPGQIENDLDWPDTVIHARDVLSRWRPDPHLQNLVYHWDAGTPPDHEVFPKSKHWVSGGPEEREKIVALWRSSLSARSPDWQTARELEADLSILAPLSATPSRIRSQIQDLAIRLGKGQWAENVTMSLLQRFPADSLPLSRTSLALARYKNFIGGDNQNHLLGFPPKQRATRRALAKFQELGWLEKSATSEDVSLLLRIAADGAALAINLGNADAIYFFLPKRDLESGDFNRSIALASSD